MKGWPEPVAKGPALQRLDELSQHRSKLLEVLADLRTPNFNLITIGLKHGVLTQEDANFVENEWFLRWSTAEERIRQGLIDAIELALNNQVAISSYWICPGYIQSVHVDAFLYKEEPDEVEVEYPNVINLNIYTPWPKPTIKSPGKLQ